jgi:alpha-galactosidase
MNLQEYQLGTRANLADTDGDGLNDGTEVAGAGARPPTSPLLADTDGDGLSDAAESNTGGWVNPSNTGTNPTKWDTDGDGLSDGVESNTGVYVSATNTGSNPFVADTDGDGAGDWYEVAAAFTSPVSPSSKPNIPYPLPKPDATAPATNKPVKVFILMGQSNMVGQGNVDSTNTPGTLSTIVKQQNKFPNLLDTNRNWSLRNDVTYKGVVAATAAGPLTVGQGSGAGVIGPELGFGHVMGYYHNEPVLVLKTSEGGKDLGYQLLPPGSQRYTNSGYVYAGYGDSPKKWLVGSTPIPDATRGGEQYDKTVAAAKGVLTNFNTLYTNYAAQGYVIAGFGWFQGWNDIAGEAVYPSRYETNLANYIRAIRTEFNVATNTPFVVAGCGFDGWGATGDALTVINAQLAMTNAAKYPEFVGNVQAVETRGYWRTVGQSPADQGYHYNRNAETFMLVGDVMGRAMLELLTTGSGGDYANWATNFLGANLADPNADFDGDGRSNDYERIWGLNPTNAAPDSPFVVLTNLKAGNFTYTRRTQSLAGLNFTVWTSTNLVNWAQDTGAVQTPAAPVNAVETVSVTLSPDLINGAQLFVRLRAGQP